MVAVVCSVRKENQALKLHILSLKERVKALENRVVALKDNNQNHTTCPRGHSKPKSVNRPSTGMTNNSRPQPKSSGYAGTRVFRYKSYAQAASAEDNGKARDSRGNTHFRSSLAGQHDQAGGNVGNDASFRVIWGTRFSTTVESVKSVLSHIIPLDSELLQVTKSVRRKEGRTRWWFTIMAPPDTLSTIEASWSNCIQSNWKLQGSLRPPVPVQRQLAVDAPERCKRELQQPGAPSSIEQEPELISSTISHSALHMHADAKADTATVHDPLTTNTALPVEDLPREKSVRSNVPSCDTSLYPELAVGDTEASLTSPECPPEGSPNHV